MGDVTAIRPVLPTPDADMIDCLQQWLALAKQGKIVSLVVAAELSSSGEVRLSRVVLAGWDRWKLIGAVEASKHAILDKFCGDVP